MKCRASSALSCLVVAMVSCSTPNRTGPGETGGSVWVTTADRKLLMKKLSGDLVFTDDHIPLPSIDLDPVQKFQTMDGFGYSLTGGSAMVIHKMPEPQQESLLKELFLTNDQNIGVSYLRLSVGGSDLDDHAFTYDDLPPGKTDVSLSKFSIAESEKSLIPVLRRILALNPDIKIMGSPWSAPAWMKTNHSLKGGSLKPEYYGVYAQYFVNYIKAFKKNGITIDAVTIQNEPENPKNTPSMVMTAEEEIVFVKDHLGPAFQKDSIQTKIVVYDHNCDHPEYAIKVLNDPVARKRINGTAFHLYDGHIDSLSVVHLAHPDKSLYFTEQWTSGREKFGNDLIWHTRNLIIGACRNWSVNVLEWNLASDPWFNPHTNSGGCTECMGAVTIGKNVTRNVSWYIIAQASKFVRPGSVRIASTTAIELPNVAFVTPDSRKVLIVLNESDSVRHFAIRCSGQSTAASLPAKAVGTFVW